MIGLVLQGGGAKGGYHIGVWKALRELNIEIGAVTGTSVGALNGVLIAQGDYETAHDIWYNMDPRLVIGDDPEIYHQLVTKNYDLKNTQMYFDYIWRVTKNKGLDIEPLKILISELVDEDRLRTSPIDFGLVTVSLTDWKALEIFVGDMEKTKVKDYLLASCFLPGFKPQMIDGKRYLDGGFYDNLPINLISSRGFTEIIAVELDSIGRVVQPKKDLKIRRIMPSGDTGSLLEFDRNRSRMNLKMGYYDTLRSFGKYQGDYYYLTEVPKEDFFYQKLLDFRDEQIMAMAKVIGCEKGYPRRVLTERLLPEVADMLGLDIGRTYGQIMVSVLEFLAEILEIERLKPYTYENFRALTLEELSKKYKKRLPIENLPAVLRRRTLVKRTFKVDVLAQWLEILKAYGSL